MSPAIERFEEFFETLWGYGPFPWQSRLARQVFAQGWPDCIDLPTASGKTAAIDIAVFVLACQADRSTNDRTVGRRIFFTVNRRVIVDEAYERSYRLAKKLLHSKDGILREVADALHQVSGDGKAPPLDVAQLRGGIYRDRAWARSITQPMVVCTTADQLGSRLLFRGYGVSPSMRPVHAALTACDSLILLDEAHVTRAFSQTMQLIERYRGQDTTSPPTRFVQMTATPAGLKQGAKPFELEDDDRAHPILSARHGASKPAALVKLKRNTSIGDEIVRRAFEALSDTRKAVGIIVNRVQTAREIERLIQDEIRKRSKKDETFKGGVHLVIGRMRPVDRDDLQGKLRTLVGPERSGVLDEPVFIVATQCLEVGADYDFDALFTECASVDALRQRFGRLNRQGRKNASGTPIEVAAAIITNEASLKDEDPVYGNALKNTWEWLTESGRKAIDFGITDFKNVWDGLDQAKRHALLAPAPDAAVLLPAHIDALCQTAPQPEPSPDVSYFIHGPQRDNAEVNVCWRADLGPDDDSAKDRWPEIVRLLPPTSPECMTVPLVAVKRLMGERYKSDADADVPTRTPEVEEERERSGERRSARAVVWRYGHKPGADTNKRRQRVGFVADDPRVLKPGDTIVMPVSSRSWIELGHIPDTLKGALETDDEWAARCPSLNRSVDVAERATRQSRRRLAIRLHDAFPGRDEFRGLRVGELRPLLRSMLEKEIPDDSERRRVMDVLDAAVDRHQYEVADDEDAEGKHNELVVFKTLIDPPNKLELPVGDEDDGDDNLSEGNRLLSLDEHTKHVVDRMAAALGRLHLDELDSTVRASAPLHDLGKADVRFQAMLAGITPYEAIERPTLLGKGDGIRRTRAERQTIFDRAMYPRGFRHEMLTVELVEHLGLEATLQHRDLLLHMVAAHHGHARPFAPICFDDAADAELRSLRVNDRDIPGSVRKTWTPSHRLDSGIAERFWKLTRDHGWWGLAWLESILRLADQQASAAEQEGGSGGSSSD